MKTKKTVIYIIITIAVILIITAAASSFFTVRENEYACIVRFSKIVQTVDNAGLHLKIPFIDSVQYYPKTILLYDLKPSDVLTADAKAMSVDSYVIWKIANPLKFFQSLGRLSVAEDRLDAIIYNALKEIIGKTEQNDIISSQDEKSRNYLNEVVFENVRQLATTYGIEVMDIKIIRFDLPEDNEQAVYGRMITDRNRIAELYRAEGEEEAAMIRNGVDKEVNIIISNAEAEAEAIKAEGEAEYMKIMADAFGDTDKRDFYVFMRGLDALKESLTGSGKTVILDRNSELARILLGS